jgi:preprotein translocase subunit SecE
LHIGTFANLHIVFIMNKLTAYLKDSYKELVQKVTWPSWDQLQQSTMIVLGATLVITFVVGVMDFAASNTLKFIYSLFKS